MKRIENKPIRFIFNTAERGKGHFSTIFQELLTCLVIFGTDCNLKFNNNLQETFLFHLRIRYPKILFECDTGFQTELNNLSPYTALLSVKFIGSEMFLKFVHF